MFRMKKGYDKVQEVKGQFDNMIDKVSDGIVEMEDEKTKVFDEIAALEERKLSLEENISEARRLLDWLYRA